MNDFAPVPDLRQHSLAGRLLRDLLARRGAAVAGLDPEGRRDLELIRETRRLTPLLMADPRALTILAWTRAAARLGGAMAEAGVFMGGSARVICEAKGAAPLHLFDVFETLQGDRGLAAAQRRVREHFGRVHSTLAHVEALLRPYPAVRFHPGYFPASAEALRDERFCFVHIDMDLGPGTGDALAFFHPLLVPGGVVIGDDYNLPEVRVAFEAFYAGTDDVLTRLPWGQAVAVKVAR